MSQEMSGDEDNLEFVNGKIKIYYGVYMCYVGTAP